MFKIFIGDTRAMPVSSTKMEILVTNGYFKEKPTKNDLIYDTAFHASPELREALGHAQNRQVKITQKRYSCTVVLGSKSYTGTFYLKSFEVDAYVGHIYINEFNIDSYSKSLTDFTRPLTGNLNSQWEDAVNKQWPETPYYMPTLINHAFYDDLDTLEEDKVRPDYTGLVNPYFGYPQQNFIFTGLVARNYYTACPQPCLLELLKIGFEDAGFTMKGDFPDDPDVKKMWIHNNRCLDDPLVKDPNLTITAGNETDHIYSLSGTEQRLNFTESTGPYINTTSNTYRFHYAGKHKISLSVGYRAATTNVSNLKIKAWKTDNSGSSLGTQVYEEGTPTNDKFGELQITFDHVVEAIGVDEYLFFTIRDSLQTANIEITYIRLNIECLNHQHPYYDAFGKTHSLTNTITVGSAGLGPKLNFNRSAHDTGVNLTTDEITIGSTGVAKIKLAVDYTNAQDPPDMTIHLFRNGVFWKAGPTINTLNGIAFISIEEPIQAGVTLFFKIDFGRPNTLNIRKMSGSIEFIEGDINLITWKQPTDLCHYVPDMKFGDLVDAVLETGVVKMTVDPLSSTIYLNYKEGITSLPKQFNLQGKPFTFSGNEISGMDDDTIIKYAINDGKDTTLSEEYSKIFLYENFEWSLVDKVPNNFNGTTVDLQLLPLVQRQAFIGEIQDNLDFKDMDFTTLVNNITGYIDGSQTTSGRQNQLQLGVYDGIKYAVSPNPAHSPMATAPAHFSTFSKTLKLELNNPQSMLQRLVDWVEYLEARSRKETYTFQHLQRLPNSDEEILFKNQSFVWEQARISYAPNQPVEVELMMR